MLLWFCIGYRAAPELVLFSLRPVRQQPCAAPRFRQIHADRRPCKHNRGRGQRALGGGGGGVRRLGQGELGRAWQENKLPRRGEAQKPICYISLQKNGAY